jgi:predicted DNA-binding antitoxin AbrB/MazE fold protein
MSHTIPAVFDDGVFRPLEPVDLAKGTRVEVQVPQQNGVRTGDTIARQEAAMAWPAFVERTYGSCAGLDLERHEQGDFELREPIA